MTPKNRWKAVVVTAAALLGVCGEFAHAQEKPAAKKQASDISGKAYRLRMAGKIDKAKQALEGELAKKPRNAAAWFELARLEFQMFGKTHELDSAQKAIERATNLAPGNARYHRWAGRIAMLNGVLKARKNRQEMEQQFKRATKAAEKAVAIDPDDHEARMIFVYVGGDRNRAKQHVEAIENRSPVDGAVARCAFSLKGQQEKQIALWKKLAKKLNKDPRVHENLAREYAWSGNIEKASASSSRTYSTNPLAS